MANVEHTDQLLKIVGNETRRKILALLSEKPHYIMEISKKLNVTQPAILKHLALLEEAKVIESFQEESPFGAPRKYYKIRDSVNIEVTIHPRDFKVTKRPVVIECPIFGHVEKEISMLTDEINKAKEIAETSAKAQGLKDKADFLLSCHEYNEENWNCRSCRRIASLRKSVSEVIIQVSKGEISSGLRTLSSIMNQLTS